jgi:tetratricopeptide (TPR) repeat protein
VPDTPTTADLEQQYYDLLTSGVSPDEFTRRMFDLNVAQARASDPQMADVMPACAIPRSFDAAVIGVLRDAPDDQETNERVLDGLAALNYVERYEDGTCTYHDSVRTMLLEGYWHTAEHQAEYGQIRWRLIHFYQQQGNHHFRALNFDAALADFTRVVELYPNEAEDIDQWRGRVALLSNLSEPPDEALACFNRALTERPDDADSYYWRGLTLFSRKQLAEAREDMTRAIRIHPDQADYHIWRGHISVDLEEFDAAIADLTRAIELQPDNGTIYYYWRGTTYREMQDYPAALADFTHAIELQPDNGTNYNWRGTTHYEMRDYPAALADFTRAIELLPDDGNNYYWRGRTHLEMQEYAAALADFTRAIELLPYDGENYFWRGFTYYRMRDYAAALADFTRAIELQPDDGYNYHWRAQVSLSMGSTAAALNDLDEAVKRDPKDPHFIFWRGVVYRLLGQEDAATTDLSQADTLARQEAAGWEQERRLAKLALLAGDAEAACIHYTCGLEGDALPRTLQIECLYLRQLAHLFPDRADIQEVR